MEWNQIKCGAWDVLENFVPKDIHDKIKEIVLDESDQSCRAIFNIIDHYISPEEKQDIIKKILDREDRAREAGNIWALVSKFIPDNNREEIAKKIVTAFQSQGRCYWEINHRSWDLFNAAYPKENGYYW